MYTDCRQCDLLRGDLANALAMATALKNENESLSRSLFHVEEKLRIANKEIGRISQMWAEETGTANERYGI
jgi:hypothetical protein